MFGRGFACRQSIAPPPVGLPVLGGSDVCPVVLMEEWHTVALATTRAEGVGYLQGATSLLRLRVAWD